MLLSEILIAKEGIEDHKRRQLIVDTGYYQIKDEDIDVEYLFHVESI